MTPSLLHLLILTPPWLALIFFSMKRSLTMAGLAAMPTLALLALIVATPAAPEGQMLARDELLRPILCRITGAYMVLVGLLAAMGLLARYGVRAAKLRGPASPPSGGAEPDRSPPSQTSV